MKFTHTCCWTDHSNGCPREDIDCRGYDDTEEGVIAFARMSNLARVKRGYAIAQSEDELVRAGKILWRWRQEDERR